MVGIEKLESEAIEIIKKIANIIVKDIEDRKNLNLKEIEYQDTKNKIKEGKFKEEERLRINGIINDLFKEEKNHNIYAILDNKEILYVGTIQKGKIISRIKEHLEYKTDGKNAKLPQLIEHLQEIQKNEPIVKIYVKTYEVESSIRTSIEDYLIKYFKGEGMCKWNLRNNSN
ncbi:hypothetical protein [Bacillus sp. Hm123]|uniref:hypothetical protein n=1 Tax=Bacillus sp. Hm123 TaxID=3450745 RepID=UPI003F431823